MDFSTEYKKYKWFFTSSKKLVIGGKNAIQNDELINSLKNLGNDYFMMHTSSPGSPFSAIISDINEVSEKDIQECADFTASFSQAWKQKKQTEPVDIFLLSQLVKKPLMKTGTWTVKGKVKTINGNLQLALMKQKNILRAVPVPIIIKRKDIIKIVPGTTDKQEISPLIQIQMGDVSSEEILSALPAGGIKIIRK